jgi:hypothetical protein
MQCTQWFLTYDCKLHWLPFTLNTSCLSTHKSLAYFTKNTFCCLFGKRTRLLCIVGAICVKIIVRQNSIRRLICVFVVMQLMHITWHEERERERVIVRESERNCVQLVLVKLCWLLVLREALVWRKRSSVESWCCCWSSTSSVATKARLWTQRKKI